MKVEELSLSGLLLLEPRLYSDERGHFFESYNQRDFERAGLEDAFVQDNQSRSHRGVLRGMHAQLDSPQGKLVRVVVGEILDVAVDIRPASPTFGRWEAVTLTAEAPRQLWIPAGFAHGFLTLAEPTEVLYKCTTFYDPADEIGIRWDDPEVGIDWPIPAPRLSAKDRALPTLAELEPRLRAAARARPSGPPGAR